MVKLCGARGDDDVARLIGGLHLPSRARSGGHGLQSRVVGRGGRDVRAILRVLDVVVAVRAPNEAPVASVGHGRSTRIGFADDGLARTLSRDIASVAQGRAHGVPDIIRAVRGAGLVDTLRGCFALHLGVGIAQLGVHLCALLGRRVFGQGGADLLAKVFGGDGDGGGIVAHFGGREISADVGFHLVQEFAELFGIGIHRLGGRIDDSLEGIAACGVGQHEGELPLVATRARGGGVGQAHEHLVPSLAQLNLHNGACGEVFVLQSLRCVVLRNRGIGLVPRGRSDFCAVHPEFAAAAVPLSGLRCALIARAAVGVELHLCTHGLCLGRIHVGPGVGGLRIGGVGVPGGNRGVPDVAQIDARTRCRARTVGLSVVGEGGGQDAVALVRLLGRELHRSVAAIGEGVGDAPAHIGLLHVGDGLVAQAVGLVEEEAALEVGKLLKLLARIGEGRSACFDVLLATAAPGALGRGQHIGVHIILAHDVFPRIGLRVVPGGRDGARHGICAALLVVDIALVDTHEVGIHIKVVRIVVAAVNVGQTVDSASGRGPHLRHVALLGSGCTGHEAVPYDHFLAFAAHVVGHRLEEVGIGDLHLVATDVDVGRVGEDIHHLVKDILQRSHALIALHIEAHGLGEHVAVARHVDFGDDGHTTLSGIGIQFAALVLRVVVASIANHVFAGRQLGIAFDFHTPRQFFGEVPVEDVDLEAREQVNLSLQLLEGDERAAHVVHEAAHLEGGPVRDGHSIPNGRRGAFGQLHQGLRGADDTRWAEGFDGYGVGFHIEAIGFLGHVGHLVEESTGNLADNLHRDGRCTGRFHQRAAVVGQDAAQQGTVGRVHQSYFARQRKGLHIYLRQGLRLGQNVFGPCHSGQGASDQQTC